MVDSSFVYVFEADVPEQQQQKEWPSWKHYSTIVHIFSAKLVLEVFGGAGAIWGFSEACGFRTAATNWFWRPAALAVGAIFFLRWTILLCNELTNSTHSIRSNSRRIYYDDHSTMDAEIAEAEPLTSLSCPNYHYGGGSPLKKQCESSSIAVRAGDDTSPSSTRRILFTPGTVAESPCAMSA